MSLKFSQKIEYRSIVNSKIPELFLGEFEIFLSSEKSKNKPKIQKNLGPGKKKKKEKKRKKNRKN
ncbi:hypothetical protein BpHYR1_012101 [Brachionus plicatilis]|uniref:Uncharacterized protein n=1 Tax=Brachionus plicatilis TaxID=10195 RepID=A0A3M7R432_BRAPC|nr:hypothetical protein BpHYR1_012101 [Brachionus plicatilis]